jgi:hypothetical protein
LRNDKDKKGDVRTQALQAVSFSPLNYEIASGLVTKLINHSEYV